MVYLCQNDGKLIPGYENVRFRTEKEVKDVLVSRENKSRIPAGKEQLTFSSVGEFLAKKGWKIHKE